MTEQKTKRGRKPIEPIDLLLAKIDKGTSDECWLFVGYIKKSGYGSFGFRGRIYSAHRAAYEIFNGTDELPPHVKIMHTCDNRACCNPFHLREGTHLENMRDMYDKGRATFKTLGKEKVREIRGLRSDGRTLQSIADQFGFSFTAIRRCVNRETYAWVD